MVRARKQPSPAYRQRNYIQFRERLKIAAVGGAPVFCSIAGPKCTKVATQPHHIVPVSAGGSWGDDNLMPACRWCNNWQAHKTKRKNRVWK